MRVVTTGDFLRLADKLRKRFRRIDRDLERLGYELRNGARPRDERLQDMGGMLVFKARLRNTSSRRGSRGGFRVVYRVMDDGTIILLLLIWSKTDIDDLPRSEIRRVASKYSRFSNDP